MREPNYSESQLQQAANTAFTLRVSQISGHLPFAHVPSLIAEYDLGWDTAFHLPWLPHMPSQHDEGCNFFLQYKLSGQLTSSGAKEWSHWLTDYFRFKIPHSTRDATTGAFVDDYHQWNRLKALADKKYPTFYATNSTLQKTVLQSNLEAGTLLDHIPLLDVRGIVGLHKHVTFTPSSSLFVLHSEKEEASKLTFSSILDSLRKEDQSPLGNSNNKLMQILKELGGNDEEWNRDLLRISSRENLPRFVEPWIKHVRLASFLRKHVGVELMWLPKLD